jgi:hypothetical protein
MTQELSNIERNEISNKFHYKLAVNKKQITNTVKKLIEVELII